MVLTHLVVKGVKVKLVFNLTVGLVTIAVHPVVHLVVR
jgi:hypothetical protein